MEIANSETDLASIETLQRVHPVVVDAEPDFFKERRASRDAQMRETIDFIVKNNLDIPVMMF